MTFFEYLDEKFRGLSLELQKNYTLSSKGKLEATYQLIQVQRVLFKWFWMPVLLGHFFLVKAGLVQTPSKIPESNSPGDVH